MAGLRAAAWRAATAPQPRRSYRCGGRGLSPAHRVIRAAPRGWCTRWVLKRRLQRRDACSASPSAQDDVVASQGLPGLCIQSQQIRILGDDIAERAGRPGWSVIFSISRWGDRAELAIPCLLTTPDTPSTGSAYSAIRVRRPVARASRCVIGPNQLRSAHRLEEVFGAAAWDVILQSVRAQIRVIGVPTSRT
jgi:hypothetical protein